MIRQHTESYTEEEIAQAMGFTRQMLGDLRSANFTLPSDHVPGMPVPKGGSSCMSCVYLQNDRVSCGNDYFQQWNGSATIPAPIDSYCSDWYEPIPEALL